MAYLLFAIALSALLAWLVVWRARRPKSMEKAIDEFADGLRAIAPREEPDSHPHDRGPSSGGR